MIKEKPTPCPITLPSYSQTRKSKEMEENREKRRQ
jgi:hypothetical protein